MWTLTGIPPLALLSGRLNRTSTPDIIISPKQSLSIVRAPVSTCDGSPEQGLERRFPAGRTSNTMAQWCCRWLRNHRRSLKLYQRLKTLDTLSGLCFLKSDKLSNIIASINDTQSDILKIIFTLYDRDWPRSMIFKDDDIRVSTMKEETVKGGHRHGLLPDHVDDYKKFQRRGCPHDCKRKIVLQGLREPSHDGEFIDWATELEARTPYKNLLTDRESDELIKLVRPQYNWRCRTCGQEKIIHTNHHPSYGYIQHEGACAKPDWILLWEHHPETGSFEKGSKKRSSRGRVDEATTSRKRTRPRIIADVTGKDLVDLKLLDAAKEGLCCVKEDRTRTPWPSAIIKMQRIAEIVRETVTHRLPLYSCTCSSCIQLMKEERI
ncbi:unnamed protein product [Trichogramma brassicae]|uniref:Uncharacterized protein n=1 Tax=Trichogramma brassicae TaxID=86971 RepID=A0A6H5IP68_9HYME|nr:unnamed protein product [Trichogramma brassicae]